MNDQYNSFASWNTINNKSVVQQAHRQLEENGLFVVKKFISDQTAKQMIDEVQEDLDYAYDKEKQHNPYLLPQDEHFAEQHPRNRIQFTNSATLAYDRINKECKLNQLYRSKDFAQFLANILNFKQLHPYADPYAGLNVLIYKPGTQLGWHFDNANFVVTLMLKVSEAGGAYQYAPFIRSDNEENYDLVDKVLNGDESLVKTLNQDIGDLVIFQGKNTLHRVTKITGATSRLMAVFSFDPKAGKKLATHTQKTFYGKSQ